MKTGHKLITLMSGGGVDTMYTIWRTNAYGTNWRGMWHCFAGGVTEWNMET